jgi:hypothetical protein
MNRYLVAIVGILLAAAPGLSRQEPTVESPVPEFRLAADKMSYRAGEAVVLTMTLANTYSEPIQGTMRPSVDFNNVRIWIAKDGTRRQFVSRLAQSRATDNVNTLYETLQPGESVVTRQLVLYGAGQEVPVLAAPGVYEVQAVFGYHSAAGLSAVLESNVVRVRALALAEVNDLDALGEWSDRGLLDFVQASADGYPELVRDATTEEGKLVRFIERHASSAYGEVAKRAYFKYLWRTQGEHNDAQRAVFERYKQAYKRPL